MAVFDATAPVELQLNDYSCSVGATYWCLRSMGLSLTQQDLENLMVPGLVSEALGLLDGSGSGIVGLLRDRFGLTVSNSSSVTFDAVAARAGQQPIAIGGHRWYVDASGGVTGHWVAVRGFDGTQLLLANPGGTGPHFGQQSLDRTAFDQRGPFAAVWFEASPGATPAAGLQFRVTGTDGAGLHVRDTPAASGAIIGNLVEGAVVAGAAHAWRAVTASDGSVSGWLASEYLSGSHQSGFAVANTGGTGANLRSAPGTDASLVKLLPEGTQLSGDEHAWRKVTVLAGTEGWAADEFLEAAG